MTTKGDMIKRCKATMRSHKVLSLEFEGVEALVKRVEEEQPGIAKWVHEQRPKNEEEPF